MRIPILICLLCFPGFISLDLLASSLSDSLKNEDSTQYKIDTLYLEGVSYFNKDDLSRLDSIEQLLIKAIGDTPSERNLFLLETTTINKLIAKGDFSKAMTLCLEYKNKYCNGAFPKKCQIVNNKVINILTEIEDYENVIEQIQVKLNSKPDKKTYFYLTWVFELSRVYYNIGQLDSAELYANECLHYSIAINNQFYRTQSNNTLGLLERKKGNQFLALNYFNAALERNQLRSQNRNIEALTAVIKGNMASSYALLEQYSNAIQYYRESINELIRLHEEKLALEAIIELIELYIKLNKYGEANNYIQKAAPIVKEQQFIDEKIKVLQLEVRLQLEKGNTLQAEKKFQIYEKVKAEQDSITLQKSKQTAIRFLNDNVTKQLEFEKALNTSNQLELKAIQDEQRINSLTIQLLISVLISGGLILVFFQLKKRTQRKLDLRKKNEKEQQLERELELKNEYLSKMALNITRKHEFGETIIGELNKFKKSPEKDINSIIQYVKTQLSLDKSTFEFEHDVVEINTILTKKLLEEHPGISNSDLKLCVMIKLGLTNKQMAFINNIEISSMKKAKYRLKKKLGLSQEDSIQEYLIQL